MFTSNAEWTNCGTTQDTHSIYTQAYAVCKILERDYGEYPGCEIRGVCTKTWVDTVKAEAMEND